MSLERDRSAGRVDRRDHGAKITAYSIVLAYGSPERKAVFRGEPRISMRQMTAGGETAGRTERARQRHAVNVWGWKQRMPPV